MGAGKGAPKQVSANFAFSGFLFSVFGWALFETQLFTLGAGVRVHLLASGLGCAVSAIAFRRCRLPWLSFVDAGDAVEHPAPNHPRIGDLASCVALVAAACVFALSAQAGSIAFFALCAGMFSLLPWSRFAFCRRHFFISCAMLGVGAASVFFMSRGKQAPFIHLFYAWFLWLIAITELLFTLKPDPAAATPPEPASVELPT